MDEKIEKLLKNNQRSEAISLLEKSDDIATNAILLLRLGELLYAEGRMIEALNRFNAVVRIDPDNSKARNYVTMIKGILDYYCKDLLNP